MRTSTRNWSRRPGPTEKEIDVTLRFPAQASTRGRVRAPDDYGSGEIEVVAVPLEPFREHVRPMELSVEVDREGRFELDTMKGQRYRLLLRRNPLFARCSGPVDEVVGGATDVVLDTTPGTDIRGRVVDRWGPLARAILRLTSVGDEHDTARATTLEGGAFEIEGLLPGATYSVRYKKSEHAPEWLDLPPLQAGAVDVVLELP